MQQDGKEIWMVQTKRADFKGLAQNLGVSPVSVRIMRNRGLETEEARIALAMDSDTEKDDEIFFYCDSLDDLKSLADKGGEDFTVAGCLGFGIYEELLQTT